MGKPVVGNSRVVAWTAKRKNRTGEGPHERHGDVGEVRLVNRFGRPVEPSTPQIIAGNAEKMPKPKGDAAVGVDPFSHLGDGRVEGDEQLLAVLPLRVVRQRLRELGLPGRALLAGVLFAEEDVAVVPVADEDVGALGVLSRNKPGSSSNGIVTNRHKSQQMKKRSTYNSTNFVGSMIL